MQQLMYDWKHHLIELLVYMLHEWDDSAYFESQRVMYTIYMLNMPVELQHIIAVMQTS